VSGRNTKLDAFPASPPGAVDWKAFANLPPPDVGLRGCNAATLRRVAEACFTQLVRIATDGATCVQGMPSPKLAPPWPPRARSDRSAIRRTILVLTAYYCEAAPPLLDRFMKARRIDFGPFPGANTMMQLARHREWQDRLTQANEIARSTARIVSCINTVLGSIVLCTATRMSIRKAMDLSEVSMNDALLRLAGDATTSKSPCMAAAVSSALHCCLVAMMNYHERVGRAFSGSGFKVYSEPMSQKVMVALSQRTTDAVDEYGAKHVEDVFEVQLALLFQSLGFLVVRTRRRWRSIDLICVSHGVPDPVTILVDAKTSSHPYRLPADDERAISEYVATLRSSLQGVPALRAVLLVGGLPGKALDPKLRALEAQISLPVRYCTAGDLALLRERTKGLLRPTELIKCVLAGTHVVESSQLSALATSAAGVLTAFREFVSLSVGARGSGDTTGGRRDLQRTDA
jgi:hypothetical protein